MRVLSVSDVLGMGAGEIVPALKCRIKAVFDHKSGTNDNGAWSIQNIIVEDAQGAEIKVKVCDRDALANSSKGKWVHFTSMQSDKGMTGLKVMEDTYKGKTAMIVKCTKSAEIVYGEPSAEASASARETPVNRATPASTQQSPREAAAQTAPVTPPKANGHGTASAHDRIKAAKVFIGKRANGMQLCIEAADYINEQYVAKHGEPLTGDQYQAIASSLFISGDRAGQFDDLPAAPLAKFEPATT